MWNSLRERLSPRDNVGRQQALHNKFDHLTFIDKEDIKGYCEKLRDYQYNLEGTTIAISNAALVSKVLSTLPLTLRSQIRHLTDTGTATWESIKKSLRNIQGEKAGSKPTSRAFVVSKRGGKRDERHKNSGENDKKSSHSSIPDIQCWYCARKGPTCDNCNFKKATEKLREMKQKACRCGHRLVRWDIEPVLCHDGTLQFPGGARRLVRQLWGYGSYVLG